MPPKHATRLRTTTPTASESDSTGIRQQKAQLKSIKHYWRKHGPQLRTWWAEQSKDDRLKFLLDWCPDMPLAKDKPYTYDVGERDESYGAALAIPEWNQSDLLEGDRLIKLLAETAEVPDEGDPGSYPGYDAFTELCYANLTAAHSMVGRIKTKLENDVYRSGIVMLMPGPRFGSTFVVKVMNSNIRSWLEKNIAVPAPVFEALMYRQSLLLAHVAMCLDHFRLEVLGKECYRSIGPVMGCAQCGAVEPENSRSKGLLVCGACGMVFYCGKACQRAHWRTHKSDCKPHTHQDKGRCNREEASSPAASAAGEAGSSSSSKQEVLEKKATQAPGEAGSGSGSKDS